MVILLIYSQPDTLASEISSRFPETELRVWTPGMSPTEWQQGLGEFRSASNRHTALVVVAPPSMLEQPTKEGLVGFRHTLPKPTQERIGVITHRAESLDGGLEFVTTALTQPGGRLRALSRFMRQPDQKLLRVVRNFF